jgi:hypothetical protein
VQRTRSTKKRLLLAVAPITLVTILASAAWADFAVNKTQRAGAVTHRTVVPSADFRETQSTEWTNVPDAGFYQIGLLPGEKALVSARFTAASSCSEVGGAGEDSLCQARITIKGSPGLPMAFIYPFDTTENGTATENSVETHTIEAHSCVHNTSTKYAELIGVQVQWKVSNAANDADLPKFLIANSSLTIDKAADCFSMNT